ncbi:MAG: tetratricopeptide repeat-containing sensor histidine kinase, partial [Candidatus Stygibacter frigidus]|nr:tetratricopeptide repeat-containing sensor histidine kinase [Candidatus Stygibacter frigidus]
EFFDPENNLSDISNCYNGLGNIYYELKNYEKALKYYNLAMDIDKELNSSDYLVVKHNIGIIHFLQNDYSQAWEIYHSILDELPSENLGLKRHVLIDLSALCQETAEYEQALAYIDQVIELCRNNFPVHDLISPLCSKALILVDKERFDEAELIFEEAEKSALASENLADINEVYRGIVKLYKSTNDLEKLVNYYEKLFDVTQKMNQSDQINKVEEFETQHQINLYKEQSKILSEKNRLIAEQNKYLKDSMQNLVTKDKALENKLKKALQTINKKDALLAAHHRLAAIGEMIAIIAHQWKQPLNIISSMVFSIKDAYHFDELTEDIINEKTKMIDDLIQYLSQTMNDFRNFFKEQNNVDFKVSAAVEGAVSLLNYALEQENVTVKIDLENDFTINGSQNELTQVFLNLINNARDAFKEENITQPNIKITLNKNPDHYLISVYDNGGPIPEELCDKIFDAYVSSKGEKGTGLGLNICQTIIEDRFHGKIYFQNTLDGVAFNIEFPKDKNSADILI